MKNDALIAAVGTLGGICTTFAFVPQVVKIWKQGGRDLSYAMLGFYLVGVLLWLAYGIMVNAVAIIISNAATGTLIVVATVLKAWTGRRSVGSIPRRVSERA